MKKKIEKKQVAAVFIVLVANLLFLWMVWMLGKYDRISLDQVIFQIKTSAAGASRNITNSAVIRVGLFGLILTAMEAQFYRGLCGKLAGKLSRTKGYVRYCAGKTCAFFRRRILPVSLAVLLFSSLMFTHKLEVVAYVEASTTESDFIRTHYADPEQVALAFPEKKRNLVYIFLESMENTYADLSAGGSISADFIPELSQLAEENISFSDRAGKGGMLSFSGTTWTAAAMVAQTAGMPVKVPLLAGNYGGNDTFMPGLCSIGEILQKQGYEQTLLIGSDGAFAGRDTYFTEHGGYRILDIHAFKEMEKLPKNYRQWWGFEDEKLFAFAKEELLRLAAGEAPFNLTLLTADTHFPDGYVCHLCGNEHEEQYANVLSCSAKQVASFIGWIKEQPFYENTTVIIVGDHLTMDPLFLEDIGEDYVRTVYNCFINAPVKPVNGRLRQFGAFDMFPTTLAALGVRIQGERLGLGVNLFSEEPTLTELYGYEALNDELQKKSVFYNETFLGMGKEE
ncbi:MAG: LTA synthase family protein [Clostridia bacterium]|nr:LTA synthase family protein [Clostridia bacterium]